METNLACEVYSLEDNKNIIFIRFKFVICLLPSYTDNFSVFSDKYYLFNFLDCYNNVLLICVDFFNREKSNV